MIETIKYGPLLPDRTVMEFWLMSERGFNQQGADAAVANLIATLEYADLNKPAHQPREDDSQADCNVIERRKPSVGDFVEVEVGGQLQFVDPVRVRATTPDGTWFFLEGTETGYSMDHLTVVDPPADGKGKPPRLPLEEEKPAIPKNDLKPLFDFDSVTINTKITSQWHLTELMARLEKLKPLLPEGDSSTQVQDQ